MTHIAKLFIFFTQGDNGQGRNTRKSSLKPTLFFVLGNALPLGAIVFYLKESIDRRQEELKRVGNLLSIPANEALERIDAICRSSPSALLLSGNQMTPVMPHHPEAAPLVLTNDEVIDNIESTIPGTATLFDSITASRDQTHSKTLTFVHFGISSDSVAGKRLLEGKDRAMSLVYTGGLASSDISVSLRGTATVVEDERLKRFYWRDRWSAWIPKQKYVLVKFLPSEAHISSLSCGECLVDGVKFVQTNNEWNRQ